MTHLHIHISDSTRKEVANRRAKIEEALNDAGIQFRQVTKIEGDNTWGAEAVLEVIVSSEALEDELRSLLANVDPDMDQDAEIEVRSDGEKVKPLPTVDELRAMRKPKDEI